MIIIIIIVAIINRNNSYIKPKHLGSVTIRERRDLNSTISTRTQRNKMN